MPRELEASFISCCLLSMVFRFVCYDDFTCSCVNTIAHPETREEERENSNGHDERDHDADMGDAPEREKDVEAAATNEGDGHVVESPPIDAELEKRVRRKLDRNLVPLLAALYLLAFLDRSNIG
jgi:hypothetical protein